MPPIESYSSRGPRPRVKFTADWDKLHQSRFTTIRSWRKETEQFYRLHVGETFNLIRTNREWSTTGPKIGEATLVSVERVVPAALPAELVADDVRIRGQVDTAWLLKLNRMTDALLLTFVNPRGSVT